ncbi:C40 family peptidase [Kiloniella antarctica]|uniref:C40 family peptidase n=1 Tax=Kiloniella antarctica TaxID=1550907 RepID=A0ABW5BPE8_9PROT
MSDPFDLRLHPIRDDLVAEYLREKVTCNKYSRGQAAQIIVGKSSLRRSPENQSPLDSELLFGEKLTVYDERNGWAWVQNAKDSYVGYIHSLDISKEVRPTTHRVHALRTYVYPQPNMKSPPLDLLSIESVLSVIQVEGNFSQIQGGGWVFSAHITPQNLIADNHIMVAKRFLGTPYLWGGKTSVGIDCSGLIQVSLSACGITAQRDASMQEKTLGIPVNSEQTTEGDLIYWPGHVAIALDKTMAIHATANSMDVTIEPIAHITERVEMETGGTGITAIKRVKIY